MSALIERRYFGSYTLDIASDDGGLTYGPLAEFENGLTDYVVSTGGRHDRPDYPDLPELTKDEIRKNSDKIARVLSYNSADSLLSALTPWQLERYNFSDAVEFINYCLSEEYHASNEFGHRESIASVVFEAAGYLFVSESVNGYFTSSYVDMFAVVSPCDKKKNHAEVSDDAIIARMSASLIEHGRWCVGDCFAFSLIDCNGETVESVGGIIAEYGDDYFEETARDIASAIESDASDNLPTLRSSWHALRRSVRELGSTAHNAPIDAMRDAREAITGTLDAIRAVREDTPEIEGA